VGAAPIRDSAFYGITSVLLALNQQNNGLVFIIVAEKTPPVVTLYGDEYLSYDLSLKADTIVSNSDSTSLYFKTSQANALLFYTGRLTLTHLSVSFCLS